MRRQGVFPDPVGACRTRPGRPGRRDVMVWISNGPVLDFRSSAATMSEGTRGRRRKAARGHEVLSCEGTDTGMCPRDGLSPTRHQDQTQDSASEQPILRMPPLRGGIDPRNGLRQPRSALARSPAPITGPRSDDVRTGRPPERPRRPGRRSGQPSRAPGACARMASTAAVPSPRLVHDVHPSWIPARLGSDAVAQELPWRSGLKVDLGITPAWAAISP